MSDPESQDEAGRYEGRATVARIYDYLLGGKHNFPADRAAAQRLLHVVPDSADIARSNRNFLARVVRTLAAQGIRQFIDLGSGIPTEGNVHHIAQQVDPTTRVLYVDIDPVAIVASNEILADNPHCRAIEGDFTEPEALLDTLGHGELATIFDLDQPTALLYLSVLSQVPSGEVDDIVTPLRERLVEGSAIAISHISPVVMDTYGEDLVQTGLDVYRTHAAAEIIMRTAEELLPLFGDFELIDPGLTRLSEWRPSPEYADPYADKPWESPMTGGVAVRRSQ